MTGDAQLPFGPTAEPAPPAASSVPFTVEVVRSAKRRKTVQARLDHGVLKVLIPARMSQAEERRWVEEMSRRLARKVQSDTIDLRTRAADLAGRFGLPRPRSVRWVDNQRHRWGSCTPADGSVRVSRQLASFPPWVVDYVLVHELAHLVEANHSAAFHRLVDRYPRAERARGFLMAKGMSEDEAEDPDLAGGSPSG